MFSRSIAVIIGSIGGVLVLLGGLGAFLLRVGASAGGGAVGVAQASLLGLVFTLLLGFLILLTCRPRIFWWPGRRIFNAIVLLILGVVTWVFFGTFVVTAIGAALAVVAAVVLPIEGIVLGAVGGGRRLFHRRFW